MTWKWLTFSWTIQQSERRSQFEPFQKGSLPVQKNMHEHHFLRLYLYMFPSWSRSRYVRRSALAVLLNSSRSRRTCAELHSWALEKKRCRRSNQERSVCFFLMLSVFLTFSVSHTFMFLLEKKKTNLCLQNSKANMEDRRWSSRAEKKEHKLRLPCWIKTFSASLIFWDRRCRRWTFGWSCVSLQRHQSVFC